jgi:chromosome segregation ATPase
MNEPITNREEAVREYGAFPVPVGPELRTLDKVEDELTGVSLALFEEEQVTARLRLALASAQRGRRELRADCLSAEESRLRWRTACIEAERERDGLRARVAELEVERHSTNEALDDAVQELRKREQQDTVVAEFVAARAEYITAIRNCHPDNGHDYDRWQGHAAARRQLAELLGLPVAWPVEDAASVAKSADRLTALLAPSQALREPDVSVVEGESTVRLDITPAGGAS